MKEAITSVADTDESEEECSEESDEKCHSHSAIKERVENATRGKCFKCNVEKREIDCMCCLEVTALNEKFDKFSVKCVTESEKFQILCINKAVLENVLTGLHDSIGGYLEKDTTNSHIAMPPTDNLPGGFINGWEKATDELSNHVHYGQFEICIPS